METRVRRTAESDDSTTDAGDLQTIEGRAAVEEHPPVVDALDPSSIPRVGAGAGSEAPPDIATQQSFLRADEADEGGGDPSAELTEPDPGNSTTASRRPTSSDISNPRAADGSAPIDSDADGLTDAREAQLGTDPYRADTDNDGLTDADELAIGSSPTDGDSDIDDDGLTNAQERARGTNPTDRDTDDGEPAITMDGSVISMETGQVVAPAGPPPEPDLSGANLQGDVLGASESSGLPISGLETPPLGAPPDPGASESGDQQPSSSDDDGMP